MIFKTIPRSNLLQSFLGKVIFISTCHYKVGNLWLQFLRLDGPLPRQFAIQLLNNWWLPPIEGAPVDAKQGGWKHPNFWAKKHFLSFFPSEILIHFSLQPFHFLVIPPTLAVKNTFLLTDIPEPEPSSSSFPTIVKNQNMEWILICESIFDAKVISQKETWT